jgi:hypothetical protein
MKIANYLRVAILVAFILALACACSTKDDTNTCKVEAVETSTYLEVKPLTYKGHRYNWFRSSRSKGFGGVTHDPECLKNDLK